MMHNEMTYLKDKGQWCQKEWAEHEVPKPEDERKFVSDQHPSFALLKAHLTEKDAWVAYESLIFKNLIQSSRFASGFSIEFLHKWCLPHSCPFITMVGGMEDIATTYVSPKKYNEKMKRKERIPWSTTLKFGPLFGDRMHKDGCPDPTLRTKVLQRVSVGYDTDRVHKESSLVVHGMK